MKVLTVSVNMNSKGIEEGAEVLELKFCLQAQNQTVNSRDIIACDNNIININKKKNMYRRGMQ